MNCFLMMNCFYGMVDQRKAFSLISSRDHCQRSSWNVAPLTGSSIIFNLLQAECNRLKTILLPVNGATFQENPADSASKRLNAAQVNSVDCWFQGPPFLWQDIKYWPSGDVIAEFPNDDPELKKDITSYSTLLSEDVITSVENRISCWLKLKRVIALVLLYKQKLLESVQTNKEPSPEIHRSCKEKLIGLREVQIAELEIIRSVPSRYFGKVIALLSKQKKLEVNNRIFKFDPYVDAQGGLRVGGRI